MGRAASIDKLRYFTAAKNKAMGRESLEKFISKMGEIITFFMMHWALW